MNPETSGSGRYSLVDTHGIEEGALPVKKIGYVLIMVLLVATFVMGTTASAFADQPPGLHGYEGHPGNQGGHGGQPPGLRGYEGHPGNQGG